MYGPIQDDLTRHNLMQMLPIYKSGQKLPPLCYQEPTKPHSWAIRWTIHIERIVSLPTTMEENHIFYEDKNNEQVPHFGKEDQYTSQWVVVVF